MLSPARAALFPLLLAALAWPAFDRAARSETPAGTPGTPPPMAPEESLAAMVARPGFAVELLAAEPLTMDPVAFAWGPDLRLWIVEMADYPLGLDGQGQPGGRVRFLEDTDGDGRYDRGTLFLDGLSYPTGVMPWGRGVLVTAAPNIWYAEDTDGDGRADAQEALFVGFSAGNPQHRMNGLRWGLDNWVHCANAQSNGKVRSVKTGVEIDISGRDFRIRPDTGELETVTGRSQFMRECDDWGNWFGNSNSDPLFHFVLDDRYQSRNSAVAGQSPRVSVSSAPGAAPVFPASSGLERFNDFSRANRFTSACSAIIYRDERLGSEFVGNSFVCEPVHNLVHREVLAPRGSTFTSRRADDEQTSEFLASRDNWFRPAMVRTGPDGALWIADMYRLVVEHPEWIPAETQKRLDLRAGADRGRIYRVYAKDRPPRPVKPLAGASLAELVAALDHASGTWRDLAQQLIVARKDTSAVPALRKLFADSERPQARLHALATLEGLSDLDTETLRAALTDEHPGVRRWAVRLATPRMNSDERLARAVAALCADPDPHVRLQAAYALGEWRSAESGVALANLLRAPDTDAMLGAAALSSVRADNLRSLLIIGPRGSSTDARSDDWLARLPRGIAGLLVKMAVESDDADVRQFAVRCGLPSDQQSFPTQAGEIEALAAVLQARPGGGSLAQWAERESAPALHDAISRLNELLADIRAQLLRPGVKDARKIAWLELLGQDAGEQERDVECLLALLTPRASPAVQRAAVAALSRRLDPATAHRLLDLFAGLSPDVRGDIIDAALARPNVTALLLDGVEQGRVKPGDLDLLRAQRLLEHRDVAIRDRAKALLAQSAVSPRADVLKQFAAAASTPGDRGRGAEVFKKACAACHKVGDLGQPVGPDLAALSDRTPAGLLVSVLDPNRAVEAKYIGYTAITVDGVTHTGLLAEESGNSITLVSADGKQHIILREELDELAASAKSFMPEGLEKKQTVESLADLLAFVSAARPPRKTFPGNEPALARPEKLRGEFYLLARNAEIYGPTLLFEPRYGNLGHWRTANDFAAWNLDVTQAGEYEVWLDYACADDNAGNTVMLTRGSERLTAPVASTGNWDTYRDVSLGKIHLESGQQEVTIRAAKLTRGALLDLKSIRIRPTKRT